MNIVSISEAKKNFGSLTSLTQKSSSKSVTQMLTEAFKILDKQNDKKN